MHTPRSILQLDSHRQALTPDLRRRFDDLFTASHSVGQLVVPDAMAAAVGAWYGAGDSAVGVARASRQPLVRTANRFSLEQTLFNPLRGLRPRVESSTPSLREWIDATRPECDFCDPEGRTTADTWGRIEGRFALTAANASKYDAHHGMVVFREHNPLQFDRERVTDYFDLAGSWLERTRSANGPLPHAMVGWNCLERAGASIRHGHLHVMANAVQVYGRQAIHDRAAQDYRRATGRAYWADWARVHLDLGLAVPSGVGGGVTIAASLTPLKLHECVILAPRFDGELAAAVAAVLGAFVGELGQACFNCAVFLPSAGDEGPVVARLVGRGDPRQLSADFGTMELYGSPIVASDPYRTIEAVRAELAG